MQARVFLIALGLVLAARPGSAGEDVMLDLEQANRLAALPLDCIGQPFPYKSHLVIAKPEDLALPQIHHPAFYGCFDWHSAVHGHWSLVELLRRFPQLDQAAAIRAAINANLTAENVAVEVAYFSMNKQSETFERTYGWAWLLMLARALETWDDEQARTWAANLAPLVELVCEKYLEYLPKLVYPIRVGEHTNTAFGLSFALDYARHAGHEPLVTLIEQRAREFYSSDTSCPLSWEPSGYDFLSPCLQELDLMRKVLPPAEFDAWAEAFLPGVLTDGIDLVPAEVRDRSDGKLVHLDGLNFSRAWCLYPMASSNPRMLELADTHVRHSLGKMVDGDYSGQHWLGSFALYAMQAREQATDR